MSNINPARNYAAWDMQPLTKQDFFAFNATMQLRHLCCLGHLAPSTHNTQPWRFLVEPADQSIKVFIDQASVLPVSDREGRQAVISIGCAIENIIIGAEYFGLKARVTEVPHKQSLVAPSKKTRSVILLCHIRFVKESKTNSFKRSPELYQSIFTRKIVRAEYDPQRPLPQKIIQLIQSCADGTRVKLEGITDQKQRYLLAELQAQADGFVINSPDFVRELGRFFLDNKTDAHVGIPGISFGLSDTQAKRMHNGLIGNAKLEPEDGLKSSIGGKIAIEKSPYVGLITIARDDISHWIDAGRVSERIFLILESVGAHISIHAALVEVELINKFFRANFKEKRQLALLFRAGFLTREKYATRPHTPRLHPDDIFLAPNNQE